MSMALLLAARPDTRIRRRGAHRHRRLRPCSFIYLNEQEPRS